MIILSILALVVAGFLLPLTVAQAKLLILIITALALLEWWQTE